MSAIQEAGGWWEYRLQATSLATLAAALAAIQAAGLVGADAGPDNMLGPLSIVDSANPVNPNYVLARYGVGSAASMVIMPDGSSYTTPARGVVGTFYIAIRTVVAPAALPMDPAALGLAWSDPSESAAVLGVWE
jgi:hypothetical protein